MNKRLGEAVARVRELPEERQETAANLLFHFVEHPQAYELTPEQLEELDRRLDSDEIASEEDVAAFFASLKA
jgi:hypothetical protein